VKIMVGSQGEGERGGLGGFRVKGERLGKRQGRTEKGKAKRGKG
jgi:hypothetical protein